MSHRIRYGKADVKVYRTYGEPLIGITSIPESPFAGRDNTLAAAQLMLGKPCKPIGLHVRVIVALKKIIPARLLQRPLAHHPRPHALALASRAPQSLAVDGNHVPLAEERRLRIGRGLAGVHRCLIAWRSP